MECKPSTQLFWLVERVDAVLSLLLSARDNLKLFYIHVRENFYASRVKNNLVTCRIEADGDLHAELFGIAGRE